MNCERDMARRAYQQKQRAESAEETRRRLIQATFELHQEQGIAATTMAQIAKRAGVGMGTVYHHFQTLDETVQACGEMVMATYPLPGEEILRGVAQLRERVRVLAQALWAHLDRLTFDRVRADQELVPVLKPFMAAEQTHRLELTRAALAPFAVDRDVIRVIAALLDIDVYRSLQRMGQSLDQAADTIADIIQARVTRKD
jgi:AcrR family transcriptional regulator